MNADRRFRDLVMIATDWIWETDRKGVYTFCSERIEEILGYGPDEIVGRTPFDLMPDDEAERIRPIVEEAVANRAPIRDLENVNIAKDGRRVILLTNAVPKYNEEGELAGYRGADRDITEQRRTRDELNDRKAMLQTLLDGIPDVVSLQKLDHTVLMYNRAGYELIGKTPEEVKGKKCYELLGRTAPCPDCIAGNALATGETKRSEKYVPQLGRWFSVQAIPIRDSAGRVTMLVEQLRDITGSKRIEGDLERQTALFGGLLDSIPDLLFIKDSDGVYLGCNPEFARFVGRPREAIAGMTDFDLFDREVADFFRKNDRLMLERRTSRSNEEWVDYPDGRRVLLDTVKSPLFDAEGNTIGLVGVCRDITERKTTEQKLRQFREALDSSADAVFIIDRESMRFVDVNAAACRQLGYGSDELLFMGPQDIKPQFDRRQLEALFDRVIGGNGDDLVETVHRRKDGSAMPVEILLRPRRVGGRTLIIASVRDITERKRAEQALRESEKRFMDVLHASEDPILLIDGDTFFDCNDATLRLLGYDSRDEFLQKHPSELSPRTQPDGLMSRPKANGMMMRAFEKGVHRFEWVHTKKNGDDFPVEVTLTPLTYRGKTILHCHWRDLTEQKLIEEELLRVKAAVDSTSDAIAIATRDGVHVYQNKAFARMSGYTAEELSRLTPRVSFPDEETFNEVFGSIRSGKSWSGETEVVHKDGHSIPVLLRADAIRDAKGNIIGLIGVHTDISESKRRERQLNDALRSAETLNRELEDQGARANALAARAEMANRAKSEFLANMSHEIRTPMNGVIGMTGLLLDTQLDDEQRHYAETVRTSGESLLAIINDILDLSKIEAGKFDMETLDFDLRALLDDFADLMAIRADQKNLEFVCAADPDTPTRLRGDAGRLRQVLTNLAGNAVKFTDEGEVSVRVRVESQSNEKAMLRFAIRDTGIGIPEDKQGVLFRSFSQVDGSSTRKYGGTGLGLAISKQLAEMMGGEIGVTSREGEGSEFWFTALFEKQELQDEPAPRLPADLRGLRALVVDDNATNLEVTVAQLSAMSLRVEQAAQGQAALDMASRAATEGDPYRIVITDMRMPGMDGEELGKRIRDDEILRDTRLIMMTSMGQRGDAGRLESLGFDGYLNKPVRPGELYNCLCGAFGADDEQAPRSDHAIATAHSIRCHWGRAVRVLVADDNVTNQQVALAMLRKFGVSADAVANGVEAVAALESVPYHLVLMDVQMPEMDGLEATRAVRKPDSGVLDPDVPIVALTAHAMDGDSDRCLEAGMNDYLAKPVDPDDLTDTLNRWLKLPASAEDSDPAANIPDKHQEEDSVTEPISNDNGERPDEDVPVLLFKDLRRRMMDDDELARSVLADFMLDVPNLIRNLKKALDDNDLHTAERGAHTVKGASANVAAEAMRRLALRMEKAGKAGDLDTMRELWPGLERQRQRLEIEVKRLELDDDTSRPKSA